MKLVWSPETASKAYIDTVKTCQKFQESDHAEMISAMAGGWSPKLIVEAWSSGNQDITLSIGLDIAARQVGGRYVCIVQNERAKSEYQTIMNKHGSCVPELMVGDAKKVMSRLKDVEFMVVDGGRKDLYELYGLANLSQRGAVLMCTNVNRRMVAGFRWDAVIGERSRVVRSVIVPVRHGLSIAYVKENREPERSLVRNASGRRWIRRIDQKTGEEHVFRG